MKSIFAAVMVAVTTLTTASGAVAAKAEAGSLNCSFPVGLAVKSIVDNVVVWNDGTPDTRVYVSRINAGGPLELGGVVNSQLSLYGAACAVLSPLMVCLAVSSGGAQRASTTAALLRPRFQASPDGLPPLRLVR
jgi:hypothetical protein